MHGTFLVTIETGTERIEDKALLNPQVVDLGGKQFLRGSVSGDIKDIVKETVLSGQMAYVPLDRIVVIQQLDTN
jgi:hypothetical protein